MPLAEIRLDDIRVNNVALRGNNLEDSQFLELVDSIKRQGVLMAIVVRENANAGEDGKNYSLVDGLQRFTGATVAGLETIPANIVTRTDAEALYTQIIANAQRVDTKPVEFARGLMRILALEPTKTEVELAGELGKSPQWIRNMLGLNKLCDGAKPLVNEGKISVLNAFSLAKMPQAEQLNWLESAQTMVSAEFVPKVTERIKAIRDAARQGRVAPADTFIPTKHLRSKAEIEKQLDDPAQVMELISSSNILLGASTIEEGAALATKMTLSWVLSFDPESQAIQKEKDDARRAKQKIEAEARAKEKAAKKEADALALAQKAREEDANPEPFNLDPEKLLKMQAVR